SERDATGVTPRRARWVVLRPAKWLELQEGDVLVVLLRPEGEAVLCGPRGRRRDLVVSRRGLVQERRRCFEMCILLECSPGRSVRCGRDKSVAPCTDSAQQVRDQRVGLLVALLTVSRDAGKRALRDERQLRHRNSVGCEERDIGIDTDRKSVV